MLYLVLVSLWLSRKFKVLESVFILHYDVCQGKGKGAGNRLVCTLSLTGVNPGAYQWGWDLLPKPTRSKPSPPLPWGTGAEASTVGPAGAQPKLAQNGKRPLLGQMDNWSVPLTGPTGEWRRDCPGSPGEALCRIWGKPRSSNSSEDFLQTGSPLPAGAGNMAALEVPDPG